MRKSKADQTVEGIYILFGSIRPDEERQRLSKHLDKIILIPMFDQPCFFSFVFKIQIITDQGPVSRKSRKLFGPEKPFVKLRPAYSVKLIFSYVVKGIKIKKKQSFVPRDGFVLKTQRESCHPKCARKVSGLSRNGPLILYQYPAFLLLFLLRLVLANIFIVRIGFTECLLSSSRKASKSPSGISMDWISFSKSSRLSLTRPIHSSPMIKTACTRLSERKAIIRNIGAKHF